MGGPDYLARELVSHTRRVCSLYKKMIRDIDFTYEDFFEGRFEKLKVRAEFDKHKNIKDVRQAKAYLLEAEAKFRSTCHPNHDHGPPLHAWSKEGIAYGRNLESPDWIMDVYHPLEKAQYPYYYAKREAMKEKYLELWRRKVYKNDPSKVPDNCK